MTDPVRLEHDGPVAVVTIEDPPLNLFSERLVDGLLGVLDQVEGSGARALVLRADGRVFTGGVDVNVFDGMSADDARIFCRRLIDLAHRVEELPFPTIACVHGLCLTAGFELALACDMIWAAESAQFGLVEIVVGVTPLMGGTQRVAERAGPARARELVMSGGLYPAATLATWNVVNRVLPDGELEGETRSFAERLATGPTLANLATKRVVRAFLDHGVRGADERVCDIAAPLFETDDMRGAVRSFLEQGPGKATFEGR